MKGRKLATMLLVGLAGVAGVGAWSCAGAAAGSDDRFEVCTVAGHGGGDPHDVRSPAPVGIGRDGIVHGSQYV